MEWTCCPSERTSERRVKYSGFDPFDARDGDVGPLSVKQAHRVLKPLGAAVRLVPGYPGDTLAAWANSLMGTDLLLVSADVDLESLDRAWFYVPRMLHERSLVLNESVEGEARRWDAVPLSQIHERAAAFPRRRAA